MPRHSSPPGQRPSSGRRAAAQSGREVGDGGAAARWRPLAAWYAESGRHHLPWRHTGDPWAVLVSEVMLQQTSVARVLRPWRAFLARWPTAAACAAAPLDAVLRAWAGLGYPRRARALHAAAAHIVASGWPDDEVGLRALPGVGAYTARALRVLALGAEGPPPRDVNVARVAARAELGVEAHQATPRALDAAVAASRRPELTARDHVLALFDLGATVCTARAPRCADCPLAACRARGRLLAAPPPPRPRRQPPWPGSMRQLRGAVLAAALDGVAVEGDLAALRERVATLPLARSPGTVEEALASLRRDGLLGGPAAFPL